MWRWAATWEKRRGESAVHRRIKWNTHFIRQSSAKVLTVFNFTLDVFLTMIQYIIAYLTGKKAVTYSQLFAWINFTGPFVYFCCWWFGIFSQSQNLLSCILVHEDSTYTSQFLSSTCSGTPSWMFASHYDKNNGSEIKRHNFDPMGIDFSHVK